MPAFLVIQAARALELIVDAGGAILTFPAIAFVWHTGTLGGRMPADKG
jgi:hypothetical protein